MFFGFKKKPLPDPLSFIRSTDLRGIKDAVHRLDEYIFRNAIRVKKGLKPKNGWAEYYFYHGKFIAYITTLQYLGECFESCDYFNSQRIYWLKDEKPLKVKPRMQRFSGVSGNEIKPLDKLFKNENASLIMFRKKTMSGGKNVKIVK